MSKRTLNQERAIAWYCQEHHLVPQLSTYPLYYFRDKNGKEHGALLEHIVMNWKRSKKKTIS